MASNSTIANNERLSNVLEDPSLTHSNGGMNKPELVRNCKVLGLSTEGCRADLVDRLRKSCQCDDFKWQLSDTMQRALDLFIERHPQVKIGKVLGGGAFSKAFTLGIRGEGKPCYSLLIRKRSTGQTGGIASYSAAAEKGAALPVLDHFVAQISPHTFDYIVTQRLSSVVGLDSLDNTEEGQELQRRLIDAVIKLGESQVVHGDEYTKGNIMMCKKDKKVYFVDFSDKNYDGFPTRISEIPTERESAYQSLFEEYMVKIDDIRAHWADFATADADIPSMVSIMSLFNILSACVMDAIYMYKIPNYKAPRLLVAAIYELSRRNLSEETILELVFNSF